MNWGLSGEGVLYGSPDYDITNALLEFMNDRYEPTARKQIRRRAQNEYRAAKKNAHIVEYVLYVWQMEDLVGAQFSETAIEGLFNGEGGPIAIGC